MKRKYSMIAAALLVTCSLTACQRGIMIDRTVLKNGTNGDSESSEIAEEETSTIQIEQDDEELEIELYNTYININNFMVGRLQDSLERYFKYVDIEQDEFTLLDSDDDYFSCYSLSQYDIEDVESAYEMVNSKSEKTDLDEAFLALYPSISVVMSTLNDIYEYTDMKSYLDDDYQRAKEYHTTLMEALVDYVTIGDIFLDELDVVATKNQTEALEQMKEEGYEVLYTMTMVLHSAMDIENELDAQGVWDENILDMDMEKMQPLYDEFVFHVELLLEYSKDDDKLKEEGIPVMSAYWSSFIRDMKETKTSLTEVLQKVKNGEELSTFDLTITSMQGQCSLSSFAVGVTAMINDYNQIISY